MCRSCFLQAAPFLKMHLKGSEATKALQEKQIVDIQTDDYSVQYDPTSETVYFRGFLRLEGIHKYQNIMDTLMQVADSSTQLTIDLHELEFLNSSGISMLSMFMVKVRDRGNVELTLKGSDKILWQTKSLKNLQRLMPTLKLEFV